VKITAQGYINNYRTFTSSKGMEYAKYTLVVNQSFKGKNGERLQEKLYVDCVDFSGKEPDGLSDNGKGPSTYAEVVGKLTITKWEKGDKKGFNFNMLVESHGLPEAKDNLSKTRAAKQSEVKGSVPEEDPFEF
jgi:hypothetical protein